MSRALFFAAYRCTIAMGLLLTQCHRGAETSASSERPEAALKVTCAAVQSNNVADVLQMRGTVVARLNHDATLASQVAGRLLEVSVHEGERVRQNQVVARVEDQPTRDVLTQMQASRELAAAALQNANLTFGRAKRLFERGLIPHQQVDDDDMRLRSSAAALRSADAAVNAARRQLERTLVRTPLAGVITRVMRRSGELVDGTFNTAIAEVAETTSVDFLASAPPDDLVMLNEHDVGDATFDALPGKSYPLEVAIVAPSVDPLTGVGTVRLHLQSSEATPPLGLYGTANVAIRGRHQRLTVPKSALRHAVDGGLEVVLCKGQTAHIASVTVAASHGDTVEIVTGVTSRDSVVTDRVVGVQEGQKLQWETP